MATEGPFHTDPLWLGRALLSSHDITEEQFASAQEAFRIAQGKPFTDVLEQLGLVTAQRAAGLLAARFGLPLLVQLAPERTLARSLPKARARARAVIPIAQKDHELHIAVADPVSYTAATAREDFPQAKLTFVFSVAPRRDILDAIDAAWTEEAPADNPAQFLDSLCQNAIRKRASDIHLEPKENTTSIRFRIDGELIHEAFLSARNRAGVLQAVKIAAKIDISERRLPQDGQFQIRHGSNSYTFRASTLPVAYGEKATIRISDDNGNLRSFAELGMGSDDIAKIEAMLELPVGTVLCTGPTGSGKTTFLFSAIERLDANKYNIVTIEDPIERLRPKLNQTKVEPGIGLTFARVLRAELRQDPDIILVGEIRDEETAQVSTQAALTGHLVLSTLHTNDAASAVTRLIDMKVEPFLVASTVKGVIAMRLLRRICLNCKKPDPNSDLLAERFNRPGTTFYRGEGCDHCRRTGYHGRVGIFEVFPLHEHGEDEAKRNRNLTVHRIITRMGAKDAPTSEQDLVKEMLARGHRTLLQDGLQKAAAGLTTLEEVLSNL